MRTRDLVTSVATRVAVSIVMVVLGASLVAAAQSNSLITPPAKTVTEIKSGFLGFFTGGGRTAEVLITELNTGTRSTVRVTFFNDANKAVFKQDAVLDREQPIHVVLPLDMAARRVNLRLVVTLTRDSLAKSLPVVVLEDVDPLGFTIEDRISCAPPEHKDNTTPYCPPPAIVRTFTAN
jgi:hypothetical protein